MWRLPVSFRLFLIIAAFIPLSFFSGFLIGERTDGFDLFFSGSGSAEVNNPVVVGSAGITNASFSGVDLSLLGEAYKIVRDHYIDYPTIDKKTIAEGVVRGMIDGLGDKHTTYFNPKETEDFRESLDGEFEGIGAYVGENELGVSITKVIENSPALKSGLQAGDIIIKADGIDLAGLSVQDAISYIRGPAGSTVHLDVARLGQTELIKKEVIRAHVDVPSTLSKTFDLDGKKIGYIGLSVFGKNTDMEFYDAYKSLLAQNIQGIVIDLRYNPGGFLEAAVNILSNFVEKNQLLVRTESRDPKENIRYVSKGNDFADIPVVVLVDENSASASEILSGAMQDYELAVIVGTTTYGKGSVQQEFGLSDGGEVKITIAKWLTPDGNAIDGLGITPDVVIDFLPEDYKNLYDRQLETAKETLGVFIDTKSRAETIKQMNDKLKVTTTATGMTATGAVAGTGQTSTGTDSGR